MTSPRPGFNPAQNRVAAGVPTGGQFTTGARPESGISLGDQAAAQTGRAAPAQRRVTRSEPTRAERAWARIGRVLSFGLGTPETETRADRAGLVSQGGAVAGSAALAGGAALGAPVLAAGAAAVLAVSAVGVLATTAVQARRAR